jgi:hypothetical protein
LGNINSSFAQSSFSVSADTVFGVKPSDYFVFYNYIEFGNNTADTIQMHREKVESFCSNPGEPGNIWNIAIQDHVNFYNPANQLGSGNFFIPTITGSTDKFLLHLFPNNLAGHLVVKFKFYPIDNPSDSTTVVFDYTVTEVVGVDKHFVENNFKMAPNPASQFFNVSNHSAHKSSISVFNSEGKILKSLNLNSEEREQIDCSTWPNGAYFVKVVSEGKYGMKHIVINNN